MEMEFTDEWPYISWNIEDICSLRSSYSGDISVKGQRFHLILEKKFHINAKDDCLEMQLVDTEMESKEFRSFMVSVYLKDARGENHFVQRSRIVYGKCPPIKLIWRVTLFDLFENTSLNWKASLNIVCMFGPESQYQRAVGEDACDTSNLCSCKKHLEKLSLDLSRLLVHDCNGDLILTCEGKTFPAHKNILSARSLVFKKVIENECFDKVFPNEINISNIDLTSLGHLLIFLYNGKVLFHNQTVESVVQLYEAALKYEVQGLVEECMKFLVKNLESQSACRFLLFAFEKNDTVFMNHVISFILKNEILNSECWIEFAYEHPEPAIQTYHSYLEKYLFRRSHLAYINKDS